MGGEIETFRPPVATVITMTANSDPLVGMTDKLAIHTAISIADRKLLLRLPYTRHVVQAGEYLMREGDSPDNFSVLVSGFAGRHKTSGEEQRQIVTIHTPGEIFDLQQLHLETADHNIQSLTRCEIATIPRLAPRQLADERVTIAGALVTASLIELAVAREWLLNIGRRNARARIAHLICEMALRLSRKGRPPRQSFQLPLTQEQLGDAVGLTSVHVNSTLKALAKDGLLPHSKHGVLIPHWGNLVGVADFDSRYLHMNLNRETAPSL
jgi:CRP-like cAMP-binding protein